MASVARKDTLKRHLPKPLLKGIRAFSLSRASRADRRRYLNYSSSISPEIARENAAAWLTMLYHNIEKGLSLPEPRPGFGIEVVARLITHIDRYVERYGDDDVSGFAIATLNQYREFNLAAGLSPDAIPSNAAISRLLTRPHPHHGGTRLVSPDAVHKAIRGVSDEFFESRSSVRQFAQRSVADEDINFAINAARKSPAVCNRQFGRVRITQDRQVIHEALAIQGGARGFSSGVPALAVITTSVRTYWNAEERMQPWTDGGMFAMSFILGLHARGLGAVCLNWSKLPATDASFRQSFAIDDSDVIVMFVAFGHLPEAPYAVAYSPRSTTATFPEPLLRKQH